MRLQEMWEWIYQCVTNGDGTSLNYWRNLPSPSEVTDSYFYAELAWCVYNGGMSERIIRSKWPALRSVYHEFDPDAVVEDQKVLDNALKVFNHRGKANAVISAAHKTIKDRPIGKRLASMADKEILEYLQTYPFIGPVTRYHVARNCGLDVVKPDVHLVRLSEFLGYKSPDALVNEIAVFANERKGLIDYVLWRFLSWAGPSAYETISLFM